MHTRILYILWVTSFISCYGDILKEDRRIYESLKVIAMGPTGVGKSSLINWWRNKGTEIAKEGPFESLTSNVEHAKKLSHLTA